MTRNLIFAAALIALGGATAQAGDYSIGAIKIEQPWSRATPAGAGVGVGYLKLTNTGSAPDRLVGGTSPVAANVEIHEMAMTNGVMTMRPLANGIEIKPGETVELKPGSSHIMLKGLKQPLKQGDTVKGTLQFEKAGSVEIGYAVMPIGGNMPSGHGGMQH